MTANDTLYVCVTLRVTMYVIYLEEQILHDLQNMRMTEESTNRMSRLLEIY